MKNTRITRRRMLVTSAGIAVTPFVVGCGGVVGEAVVVVTLLKLAAVGAVAVAVISISYFEIQNAYLDSEKKRLELEGFRNGKWTTAKISLTDEQIATIQKKGKLEIQFSDGKKTTVKVSKR